MVLVSLCYNSFFLDGGFENFKIISMGGDKVFLYPIGDVDVMLVFTEATDFF